MKNLRKKKTNGEKDESHKGSRGRGWMEGEVKTRVAVLFFIIVKGGREFITVGVNEVKVEKKRLW